MRPLGDEQRYLVSAAGHLEAGLTEQETAGRLRERFGWLTEEQAAGYVEQAYQSLLAGGAASNLPRNERLGSATGDEAGAGRDVTVEALVTIDWPGRDREYRTVRLRGRSTDEFAGEVRDAIGAIVDDWAEQYSEDVASYGYEIRLVY